MARKDKTLASGKYKLVFIKGIHAEEEFINGDPLPRWQEVSKDKDTMVAILYKGGYEAPLSGTPYYPILMKTSRKHMR